MEENDKNNLLGKARHIGERLIEVGGEVLRLKSEVSGRSKTEWLLRGGWPGGAVMRRKI